MENEQQRKYWFFGSKLNTFLLLVLIVLMIIALRWMFENKNTYIPVVTKQYDESPIKNNDNYIGDNKDDTLGFVDISKQRDSYSWVVNQEQDNQAFYRKDWNYKRQINPTRGSYEYTFMLPSGNYINWADTGQSCNDNKEFKYGFSTSACVNGWTAWLGVKDVSISNTKEDINSFGDFVLKNN